MLAQLALIAAVACLDQKSGSPQFTNAVSGEGAPETNQYTGGVHPLHELPLFAAPDLTLPAGLALTNSLLLVLNPYDAPHLFVIDRRTGRRLCAVVGTGGGPTEVQFAQSVAVSASENRVWIADPNQGRIVALPLDSLCSPELAGSTIVVGSASFRNIARLGSDRFLSLDMSGAARFVEFNDSGRVVRRFGTIPRLQNVPPSVGAGVYQSVFALGPGDSTIVLAGLRTGTLAFCNRDCSVLDSVVTPITVEPAYSVGGHSGAPSMVPDPSMRYGYLGVAAGPEETVALFSGRSLAKAGQRANAGTDLHVFSWNGQLVEVLRLDVEVSSVAVDWASRTLYGTRWGEDPGVIAVSLP